VIKKGDIILIRYKKKDFKEWLIRKQTNSKFTHVAWVINETEGIEVLERGIIITPLKKFYDKTKFEIKVKRIKNIDRKSINRALDYIISKEKRQNKYKLWLACILTACNYKGRKPRETCSGLMAICLAKVKWYFNQRKIPGNITPKDIEICPKLNNIKEYK
jgi:hypothetical protein